MPGGRTATASQRKRGLAPTPAPPEEKEKTPSARSRSTSSGKSGPAPRRSTGSGKSGPASSNKSKSVISLSSSSKSKASKQSKRSDSIHLSSDESTERQQYPEMNGAGHIGRTRRGHRVQNLTLNLDQFPKARQEVIHNLVEKGVDAGLPTRTGPNDWKSMKRGELMTEFANTEIDSAINRLDGPVRSVSSLVMAKIFSERGFQDPNGAVIPKLQQASKIVFTENLGGWHWRVWCFNRKKGLLELFDSSKIKDEAIEMTPSGTSLAEWMSDKGIGAVKHIRQAEGTPKQDDGSSCGAYSALFALSNAIGRKLPSKINDMDAREFVGNAVMRMDELGSSSGKKGKAPVAPLRNFIHGLKF